MKCFNCSKEYTCLVHRKIANNPNAKNGFELPHDDVLLTENLAMLNKQLSMITDPKKRLKIVEWISLVESRLYQKKVA
jgi:hypothetical protein